MNIKTTVIAKLCAISILIVNVAISFGVVAIYAYAVEPGHDATYYQAAAQWLAPLSSIAFGWLLFMAVTYWSTRHAWATSAMVFALTVFVFYAAIDVGILLAAGGLQNIPDVVAVSLATKLVGSIAGVHFAQPVKQY